MRRGLVLRDDLGPVLRGERTTERTRRRIAGTNNAAGRVGRRMINFAGRDWSAAAHAVVSCHALQGRRSKGSERGPGMSHSSLTGRAPVRYTLRYRTIAERAVGTATASI